MKNLLLVEMIALLFLFPIVSGEYYLCHWPLFYYPVPTLVTPSPYNVNHSDGTSLSFQFDGKLSGRHCIAGDYYTQYGPPDPAIFIRYGEPYPEAYDPRSRIISFSSSLGCGFTYQRPPLKLIDDSNLYNHCYADSYHLSLGRADFALFKDVFIYSRYYAPLSVDLELQPYMVVFSEGLNAERSCHLVGETPHAGSFLYKCDFPLPQIMLAPGLIGVDQDDLYNHYLIVDPQFVNLGLAKYCFAAPAISGLDRDYEHVATSNPPEYTDASDDDDDDEDDDYDEDDEGPDFVDEVDDSPDADDVTIPAQEKPSTLAYGSVCLDLPAGDMPSYKKSALSGIGTIILADGIPSAANPVFCSNVTSFDCTGYAGSVKFFEPGNCLECTKTHGMRSSVNFIFPRYAEAFEDCLMDPIRVNGYRYEVCWPDFAYELNSHKKIKFFDCSSLSGYRESCSVSEDFLGYRIFCDGLKCPPPIFKPMAGFTTVKLYLTDATGMTPTFYSAYRASYYKTRGATVFLTDYGPGIVILVLLLTIWVMMLICFAAALVYSVLELIFIKYPGKRKFKGIYLCGTLFFAMFLSLSYFSYGAYKTLIGMQSGEVLVRSKAQLRNFKSKWIFFSFIGFFAFPLYFFVVFIVGLFLVSKVFTKKMYVTKVDADLVSKSHVKHTNEKRSYRLSRVNNHSEKLKN